MNDHYRSVAELEEEALATARRYPDSCKLLELPERSCEGRRVLALAIGDSLAPRIVVTAGVHGSELLNGDLALQLAHTLCSKGDLGLGALIVPIVNPDGRAYAQTPARGGNWRRNRNPRGPVDLNRNFDFCWSSGIGSVSATDSAIYNGASPLSEPEARNLRYVLEANVIGVVDLHSHGERILYPWGNELVEPMSHSEVELHRRLAIAVCRGIGSAGGPSYDVLAAKDHYPSSGTFRDYAYQRLRERGGRAFAFTIETARTLHPARDEAAKVMAHVTAGLVELIAATEDPSSTDQ